MLQRVELAAKEGAVLHIGRVCVLAMRVYNRTNILRRQHALHGVDDANACVQISRRKELPIPIYTSLLFLTATRAR